MALLPIAYSSRYAKHTHLLQALLQNCHAADKIPRRHKRPSIRRKTTRAIQIWLFYLSHLHQDLDLGFGTGAAGIGTVGIEHVDWVKLGLGRTAMGSNWANLSKHLYAPTAKQHGQDPTGRESGGVVGDRIGLIGI